MHPIQLLQGPFDEKLLLEVERRKVPMSPVPWSTLFRHPAFWAAAVAQYVGANAYFTMFRWTTRLLAVKPMTKC